MSEPPPPYGSCNICEAHVGPPPSYSCSQRMCDIVLSRRRSLRHAGIKRSATLLDRPKVSYYNDSPGISLARSRTDPSVHKEPRLMPVTPNTQATRDHETYEQSTVASIGDSENCDNDRQVARLLENSANGFRIPKSFSMPSLDCLQHGVRRPPKRLNLSSERLKTYVQNKIRVPRYVKMESVVRLCDHQVVCALCKQNYLSAGDDQARATPS